MKVEVTFKEVLFGVIGTVLGGLVVSLLASNHSLESQLKAIEVIDKPLKVAIEKTTRADLNANTAIAKLQEVQNEVDAAREKAQKILADLNGSELFAKGKGAMNELRELAKNEAGRVARERTKKEVFSAYLEEHVSSGKPAALSFERTETQLGEGWNGTDTFSASVEGVYEFSIGFMRDAYKNNGTTDDVYITIRVNGKSTRVRAWAGEGGGNRTFASALNFLHLKKGDRVQAIVHSDGEKTRFLRRAWFAGNLVAVHDTL